MSSYFEQHQLFCVVWSLGTVAYKCRNTKNKNPKFTFFSVPRNRKIGLYEEHFEESCSSKPVDLGRRWTVKINSCLISFFIYNIYWRRFLCSFVFWVKLLAIYFTVNGLPRKLIDRSISTISTHKEQKQEREKRLQHRCFPVHFAEFLRTPFLRTITVAASEDEHDKTKLLQWHAIELMLSLNDSFWIILATRQNEQVVTLFYSKPKVKMRQN